MASAVEHGIRPSRRGWIAGVLALMALAGCATVSPQHVTTDRMDYGQVVADSWKRQTLLNVVRLRYADAPVFLDVASIINSYTVGGEASALATIPSRIDPNVLEFGATGKWSNTPTVTYQPLLGDRFTKSLLRPIPPASVFQLVQGGWGATLVFRTVVGSVNGLRNTAHGVAADPGFTELTEALENIQRAGNIGIRIESRKDDGAVLAVLRRAAEGAEPGENTRRVRRLLGLEEDASEFEIAYGLIPRKPNEVAMLTRSMMEIMLQLGFGIDLPAAHAASGRALPGQSRPGEAEAAPLVRIRSGTDAPEDAYSAVPYKGYWYWIDDSDIASKRTFTFLMILFSLAETGQASASPVVTVPTR
ncbi:MAG: hypothetical protein FD187_1827 [bacterium]|nr:MAG: hypothetical protein FD142_1152 [bacterium]KAF0148638.1 MAG: hypothetical protein FD187_1827 [bacterium]KAF0167942.1 MAG: hypothetical protein FD158_1837 [bacterium]TXT18154.1 MAG: hypothetical protein FD132_2152 [bacterium]